MARKRAPKEQLGLLEARTRTAPCVPAIREAVSEWREHGYKGITNTTRILLNYWFHTDHRLPNNKLFKYHDAQREAMETLIFIYEVAVIRRHKDLLEKYAPNNPDLRLLQYDDFKRFCIKMATGSGKTKVMSLAIAWQYFNAVVEGRNDYAKVYLVLAPNVIVFERLCIDFRGGRIFRTSQSCITPPGKRLRMTMRARPIFNPQNESRT